MNAYQTRLARVRAAFPIGCRVALEGRRTATVRAVAPLAFSKTIVVWVRVPSCGPDHYTDLYRLPGELTPPNGASA